MLLENKFSYNSRTFSYATAKGIVDNMKWFISSAPKHGEQARYVVLFIAYFKFIFFKWVCFVLAHKKNDIGTGFRCYIFMILIEPLMIFFMSLQIWFTTNGFYG
jgi:hypothetical protein